ASVSTPPSLLNPDEDHVDTVGSPDAAAGVAAGAASGVLPAHARGAAPGPGAGAEGQARWSGLRGAAVVPAGGTPTSVPSGAAPAADGSPVRGAGDGGRAPRSPKGQLLRGRLAGRTAGAGPYRTAARLAAGRQRAGWRGGRRAPDGTGSRHGWRPKGSGQPWPQRNFLLKPPKATGPGAPGWSLSRGCAGCRPTVGSPGFRKGAPAARAPAKERPAP